MKESNCAWREQQVCIGELGNEMKKKNHSSIAGMKAYEVKESVVELKV